MDREVIVLNEERNVTLTSYIQPVGGKFDNISKRPAIIVIPGGAYQYCSDREAEPVAFAYLKAGYNVFILRYSVGVHATWPNPLSDYEQAMELIRSRADEWNIYKDKIAVIGFSAGGHLAASAATMSKNRPNAAILGYAVTLEYLAKICEHTAPDLVSAVDKDTCPCFLFSTRTDRTVPIENTTKFISALVEHNIAFESHIYSFGPHGFSIGDSSVLKQDVEISNRAKNWVSDSIEWLKEVFGDFGDGDLTKPKYRPRLVDDGEEYLSADCTIGYLMKNQDARNILLPFMKNTMEAIEDIRKWEKVDKSIIESFVSKTTLRNLSGMAGVADEIVEDLDKQLRQIKNQDL
ncbi:MAG: alpha/beta hydrolase [Clostridiales bacterium]|nr:alpha/beta hydrolase [Clostridiales bacterium]